MEKSLKTIDKSTKTIQTLLKTNRKIGENHWKFVKTKHFANTLQICDFSS